ncbi:selenoprotein domain protein [Cordyceps fumosorosea ARSEF 2679]|uniref:Selenoprotein domain protein n=1 Tax=Cordyceps fumosorosea (strain ARSEF 2679) TaxID=1081104 RepID=A0A168EJV4_CORFA|nr:selenoprotein domain protein [Cordyceps fumosorosea ARSEF 2679]OAA73901.1 selenoprotein domain protein [Cordyceps fumosorosea ARSEF 2679]
MTDESATTATTTTTAPAPAGRQRLPRVTIEYCTQCKWLLRAAYYAQELLSTFSTGLGEVALQPSTGGTFVVTVTAQRGDADASGEGKGVLWDAGVVLWDRKVDGGFPETKELKRRVRDVIEPGRDLGHVDRDHARPTAPAVAAATATVTETQETKKTNKTGEAGKECEDCK